MDFKKLPPGYSWATKYKKGLEVGIFPSKYKDYDVNKLPLFDIDRYYWAEDNKIFSYDRSVGHFGFNIKNPTRSILKKHLLCMAISDQFDDFRKSKEVLDECRKFYNLI